MNDELKQARNTYYHIIRQAKRICWQKFLQEQDATQGAQDEKNRCVMVDSRYPNTSVISTKANQLIAFTTQAGVTT